MKFAKTVLATAFALMAAAAHADLTIGVVQPLTGPASGLGIPVKNAVALWPKTIAGETLKVIVLDDASDPTAGVKATQRLITEDKVDVLVGSTATPVAIPMADVAAESGTPQISTDTASLACAKMRPCGAGAKNTRKSALRFAGKSARGNDSDCSSRTSRVSD